MKKVLALVLAAIMVFAVASLALAEGDSKVLKFYAWNEEFKGFFEKYYTVPEGYTVEWVITPSDNGGYQDKLDTDLLDPDAQIDMFLAEADYIQKYVDSEYTQDITKIGVTDFSNAYEYTVKAASDADGVVKGVSFQCCPSALIYRRSIAKDVLGTDDPAEVQAALDSWEKFEAVADQAKEKGYYMTASFAETYRVFSNNCTSAWVDADNNLVFDDQINAWIAQTEKFIEKEETLTAGIWDQEKNDQMFAEGKTMCFFGPAWYFNFCMGNAQDPEKGCSGDWAICQGPAAHFWGGTWLLAPTKTENAEVVADIMNSFINDKAVCAYLVAIEGQFCNNKEVNGKFAAASNYGTSFLGGQNAVEVFAGMTDNIKWENHTIYDQLLNEGLQTYMQEYFKGTVDKETALSNFYKHVNEKYPDIVTPE